MADELAKRLQSTGHTATGFTRFAKASPERAERYLTSLEANLRAVGATTQATALKKLLAADGPLSERLSAHKATVEALFPKTKADWGGVQLAREKTLQWGTESYAQPIFHYPNQPAATKAALRLTGTVEAQKPKPNRFEMLPPLFTTNGRTYVLAESSRIMNPQLQGLLVSAFIGDGPITIQGVVSEDGKTLHVEGFALNVDGEYDDFVFGRVRERKTGEPQYVDTPRGPVEIANQQLARKFAALPRLGVILPGGAETVGGRQVYRGQPDEFFALAKWNGYQDGTASKAGMSRKADMAFNFFEEKPLDYPKKFDERASSTYGRFWAKGDVSVREGKASRFVASYVSQDGDASRLAPSGLEADAVQAAVTMTDLGVDAPPKKKAKK